ncbi:hypothetical protein T484DRAFT_2906441 [Baffinella frigidus]|nr:hypothetical protein T484DRAFT_2906441 [Cryptophyta sp. CCMP2293]
MDKFGRTESADTNASQESGGAQEQNLKSGKSKRKSKKGGDEVAEKNGGRVGMHAAPSAHGGKGLHCVSYEDIRYDGRSQKEVKQELVQKSSEADENQKSTNRNLSLFQTYMNRVKDIDTWLGLETGPQELTTTVDDTGTVRMRYDGEMTRTPEGIPVQHGHATVRLASGIIFEGLYDTGAPQGKGLIVFPSGNEWHGNFDRGRLHGEGVYTWSPPKGWPSTTPYRKKYVGWLEDGRIESQKKFRLGGGWQHIHAEQGHVRG